MKIIFWTRLLIEKNLLYLYNHKSLVAFIVIGHKINTYHVILPFINLDSQSCIEKIRTEQKNLYKLILYITHSTSTIMILYKDYNRFSLVNYIELTLRKII